MYKIISIRFALIIICISLFGGCEKSPSDEIDFGGINNSVYRNKYFGLSIQIPSKWSIQDQDARQLIMKAGTEMVAGEDKNLKAVLKATELQTVNLLAVFEHPLGSPVAFNPNMACLAEQTRQMPGIKRGKDYHFHTRKILESGQVDVTFPKDISTENLGGVDFDIMHLQMVLPGITVQQKYYATIMKGYALVCIVTFSNEEQEATLDTMLDSIEFNLQK